MQRRLLELRCHFDLYRAAACHRFSLAFMRPTWLFILLGKQWEGLLSQRIKTITGSPHTQGESHDQISLTQVDAMIAE